MSTASYRDRHPWRHVLLAALAVIALAGCSASPTESPPRATTSRHASSTAAPPTTPATAGPPKLSVTVLPWRLPHPVARQAVMSTPDGVIVAGGLIASNGSTAAAYRLDLASGHATTLPNLPVPVHDVAGATVGGLPVVFGGGNASEQDVVQVGGGPGGKWHVAGHLPNRRSDLSAAAAAGRVLVLGGFDGVSPALADILATSDGRTFRVVGRLSVPVRYAAVAVANGALWVFGGERSGAEVDTVQRVDLRTGASRVVGHLRHALGHASAITLDGRILLIGGRTSATQLTGAMRWFDPKTRGFTSAGKLPMVLADSAVVTDGSSTYLVGGESPRVSDRVIRLRVR